MRWGLQEWKLCGGIGAGCPGRELCTCDHRWGTVRYRVVPCQAICGSLVSADAHPRDTQSQCWAPVGRRDDERKGFIRALGMAEGGEEPIP